jgi:hypothetical protein
MPRVKRGRYMIVPAGDDTNEEADDVVNAKLWRTYSEDALSSSAK